MTAALHSDHAHIISHAKLYDMLGAVQLRIAQSLVSFAGRQMDLSPLHGVTDMGCGTGFVTEAMLPECPNAMFTLVDHDAAMLAEAKARFKSHPHIKYREADVEHTVLYDTPTEMITASLLLHWLDNPLAGLRLLTSQANTVALAVLLDGTFANWRMAHEQLGLTCGLRPFLSRQQLNDALATLGKQTVVEESRYTLRYPDGLSFARDLRRLGVSTAKSGHKPVPLQRVLSTLPQPFDARYHVAYVLIRV